MIVRAIGPELTPPFDVPNTLADPTLELYDSTGALIASNDNWQYTIIGGVITSAQVQRFGTATTLRGTQSSRRSSRMLPPGNYTAIVSGVNNTTGVALVEVYNLGE